MSTSPEPTDIVLADGVECGSLGVGTPLYGLSPLKVGTPQCESLRGYVVRLAWEHCVRPRDLVLRVLGCIDPTVREWGYARFFAKHAVTIDGLGRYAEVFSGALSRGTGRRDLHYTTLLPWRTLLSPNGQRLLYPCPRWCPHCLAEDSHDGGGGHWQLRWVLVFVTRCATHGCLLEDRCPACGRRQPAIPRMPDLIHCDHCANALFSQRKPEVAADERQLEDHALVDDLISVQGRMKCDPMLAWRDQVKHAIERFGAGERAALCRRIALHPRAMNGWLQKGQRLALGSLFRVCRALGVKPADVFGRPLKSLRSGGCARPISPPARARRRHSQEVNRAVAAALQSCLDAPQRPSLREVAARCGVSRAYLTYWFPETIATLRRQRVEEMVLRRAERQRQRLEVIQRAIERAVDEGGHPGRKRIEDAARRAGFSLMDPGMHEFYMAAVQLRR